MPFNKEALEILIREAGSMDKLIAKMEKKGLNPPGKSSVHNWLNGNYPVTDHRLDQFYQYAHQIGQYDLAFYLPPTIED